MNETPGTVRMIDGATAPAISNVFVNNACAVCTLQITGTFTAATVLVEGIVNVASNQWVTLAAFNLSDLSLEKDGADKAGIYQVGIEGILRVRMNVTEVSGGDITIAAQFGNATINQLSKTEASNLIPVTAYDLAVAGGYTGTLEQFEADMGNSASNATAAANSANDAASSASQASASATASEAAATNMAPVYSASSTYAVGDYVLYDGALYRCTTAITTAEAWTAAHWTSVKIGPEVSDLRTQLNDVTEQLNRGVIISKLEDVTNGAYYSANTRSENAEWCYGYVKMLSDNDEFTMINDSTVNVQTVNAEKGFVRSYGSWVAAGTTEYDRYYADKREVYFRISVKIADIDGVSITQKSSNNIRLDHLEADVETLETNYSQLDDAFSAADAIIVLSSNGRFTISGNSISYSTTLYLDSAKPNYRKTITAANAHDQLPNNSTLDGSTVTITVTDNQTLVYDYTANSLAIKTRANVTKFDVILFEDYYGVKAGAIYNRYWLDKFRDGNFPTQKEVFDGIFNAAPYMGTYDWTSPAERYAKLFKTASRDIVTFAFFTDPHILGFSDAGRNEENMMNYIKKVQKVYNSVPCDFLICGGDWLNNSTSDDEAAFRLGYVDGYMRSMFKEYHPMLGNHDTNYQGTTPLTQDAIDNLWFRNTNTRHAYYKFEKSPATCYVLDSGIEHSTLTAYDYAQFDWFCNALAQDDPEHGVVFMHIITLSSQPMVTTLGSVISAYNSHSTVTINGVTYDFSGCTGHIDFAVGGHTHTDSTGTIGGIPYFVTGSNSYSSNVPVIDLVIADFDGDTRTVNLVRADGSDDSTKDRTFTF